MPFRFFDLAALLLAVLPTSAVLAGVHERFVAPPSVTEAAEASPFPAPSAPGERLP